MNWKGERAERASTSAREREKEDVEREEEKKREVIFICMDARRAV